MAILGRFLEEGGMKVDEGRRSSAVLSTTVSKVGVTGCSPKLVPRGLICAAWKEVSSECWGVGSGVSSGEGSPSVRGVCRGELLGSVGGGVQAR